MQIFSPKDNHILTSRFLRFKLKIQYGKSICKGAFDRCYTNSGRIDFDFLAVV